MKMVVRGFGAETAEAVTSNLFSKERD